VSASDFIVAGNGPSLALTDPTRIDPESTVIRVNNFFFEPRYYLGRRVDIVQVGGDRWIFPFYARTLMRACREGMYDVAGWSTHQPHVEKRGKRLFRDWPFVQVTYRDKFVRRFVENLTTRFSRNPTTGILAVINAHGLGAERITLTGIDLYDHPTRYPFEVGPNAADVINRTSGYNLRFHDAELDLAILDYLISRDDAQFFRASEGSPRLSHLPLAPRRFGNDLNQEKQSRISDWEKWSGIWPIHLAKMLRRAREHQIDFKRRWK